MKNLLKFVLFVVLLSAGISVLYDYRLKHGTFGQSGRVPEKYTLASTPSIDPKNVATLENLNRERRALVSSVLPSVVSIKTSKKVALRRTYGLDLYDFLNRNPRQFRNPNEEAMVQNSLGSGVIVSAEGHVITNNHVVDQVDQIEVQFADGRTKQARLVGADAQVDLAVLKVDDPSVKPLKFGDSDAVQAGDFVLAIGNPFGFEETVTDGIISSKGRPNRVDGFGDYLQTNAAINPGNSGGPLINLAGEVIGINTAIISRSGGSQGIGFAIPSNTVRTALESLLKQGRIIRGYLGIQTRTYPQGAPQTDGVVVGDVIPNSPAASAQLQPGDVIRKFNGREVRSFPELRSLVGQTELNKKIEIEVERNGKRITVSTELKEQPADYQIAGVAPPQQQQPPQDPNNAPDADHDQDQDLDQDSGSVIGSIQVTDLTPELRQRLDVPTAVRGVVVTDPGSDAGELRKGDVIEEVNQQPVSSPAEFKKAASSIDPNQTLVLSVCRRRTRSFVVVRPR
jgi:serine protease Do